MISIIIPVYNHAHILERSLCSVCAQTYRPLEVIIVNDGSTDNFEKVMSKIIMKNMERGINNEIKIKVINQENKGASAARNRGFKEATGKYVIFWDADTIAQPKMLEKMLNALQNNPSASYAYSQFKFGWKKIKSHEFDPDLLKKINYIDATSLIRKKDYVECFSAKAGPALGWDESLKRFQDWDLWLTMLEKNKTGVFVPEVLFKKIVSGRKGISNWLPSFVYKLPWKGKKVLEYEQTKEIIFKKHLDGA